jgi:tellurite resistance protein
MSPRASSSFPPPSTRSPLEEAFFLAEDQRLIEKYRALKAMRESKQALAEVSGITNDVVLEKLVSLGTTPQTVAALAVVPLVEVAWADGEVDDQERQAILRALADSGVSPGGIEHQLVETWLGRRPGPKLLAAWRQYVHGLCEKMNDPERVAFREEVLKSTLSVAEASGGIAGLWKVSAAEREMIEQLKAAFG